MIKVSFLSLLARHPCANREQRGMKNDLSISNTDPCLDRMCNQGRDSGTGTTSRDLNKELGKT